MILRSALTINRRYLSLLFSILRWQLADNLLKINFSNILATYEIVQIYANNDTLKKELKLMKSIFLSISQFKIAIAKSFSKWNCLIWVIILIKSI